MHELTLFDAENWPAGQVVHAEEPDSEKLPAEQAVQLVAIGATRATHKQDI